MWKNIRAGLGCAVIVGFLALPGANALAGDEAKASLYDRLGGVYVIAVSMAEQKGTTVAV